MSADIEKGSAQNIENVEHVDSLTTGKRKEIDIDDDEEFTYEEQRKIVHRVDTRLVLICGLAYCISLMDRTNVSVAAIVGHVTLAPGYQFRTNEIFSHRMLEDLELYVGFRYVRIIVSTDGILTTN